MSFPICREINSPFNYIHAVPKKKEKPKKSQRPVQVPQIFASSHPFTQPVTLANYLWICIPNGSFLYLTFSGPKTMVVVHTQLLSCDMKLNSSIALQYQKRLTDEGCHREILTSIFGYFSVQYELLILFQNERTCKRCSDFCISKCSLRNVKA